MYQQEKTQIEFFFLTIESELLFYVLIISWSPKNEQNVIISDIKSALYKGREKK